MSSTNGTCSKCRQAGEKLFLKGPKCRTAKCLLDRRPTAPGQHGKRVGTKKLSEYGKQLQEKQKVKLMYGMLERQFRRFFDVAVREQGVTGDNLLCRLERRLDNVVYRLRMAISRVQARQLVVHGHITVNGKKVSSPSFIVRVGDVISLTECTLKNSAFVENFIDKRMGIGAKVPGWLELQKKERQGIVQRLPLRSDITAPIQEHLIVELYSK
ncbi:MAG: 30S ribosomal protein S4 [candidate division TM6 bacterium GW2011_GWF2_38_10]|nr:MAG: 30S ribosomal protein S4 [candidate division TM6 bacterium GW2011_GWF2_38_10]